MNSNHLLFVKTAHLASLNHLLDLAQQRYDDVAGKDHAAYGINTVFRAFPLSEKHFNPKIDTSGKAADKKVLYGLMAMGGFGQSSELVKRRIMSKKQKLEGLLRPLLYDENYSNIWHFPPMFDDFWKCRGTCTGSRHRLYKQTGVIAEQEKGI